MFNKLIFIIALASSTSWANDLFSMSFLEAFQNGGKIKIKRPISINTGLPVFFDGEFADGEDRVPPPIKKSGYFVELLRDPTARYGHEAVYIYTGVYCYFNPTLEFPLHGDILHIDIHQSPFELAPNEEIILGAATPIVEEDVMVEVYNGTPYFYYSVKLAIEGHPRLDSFSCTRVLNTQSRNNNVWTSNNFPFGEAVQAVGEFLELLPN